MIGSGQILECDTLGPHGHIVVAVIGYAHDWACYERAYPDQTTPEDIAKYGDKLLEEQARPLFPELEMLEYRE